MKLRRFLAVLLAFVILLGTTSAFAADTFTDVPEDAYYAEAVKWAVENDITYGKGDGIFAPEDTVTRAEAVTFLWRAAGRPEPTKTETFPDVESDPNNDWYKTAVQWAVEQDITKGTGEGFSPTLTCSRGMILTMLYRMEGRPCDEAMTAQLPGDGEEMTLEEIGFFLIRMLVEAIRSENALPDVQVGEYYELPIIWSLLMGILGEEQVDAETGAVCPDAPCPRGEMVSFLYAYSIYKDFQSAGSIAPDPVEVGTVPETVVLDKDGVKIIVTGIEIDASGDAVLNMTVENSSEKTLLIDVDSLFVNTFFAYPFVYNPITTMGITYYDPNVIAEAGETKDFCVGLESHREFGIPAIYEVELQMYVSEITMTEDGYEYGDFVVGDPVIIRTSLYDESVSYDMDGMAVCDRDGLRVLVCKAENTGYGGPQIAIYAYNETDETIFLDLAELKLDGEHCDAYFSMSVPAGKRSVEWIYLDFGDSDVPVVTQAEITLCTLDPETWEPKETFSPVTVVLEQSAE